MKQEPELIDLFAMFAVAGLAVSDAGGPKDIAHYAYILAHEMMVERQHWIGDDDE